MSENQEDSGLAETRSALAPTLEAATAILPWLSKPREPRFPPETAGRWQEGCTRLAAIWSGRHADGIDGLRGAIFGLYGVAIELADADCLRLAEALATTCDRLELLGGSTPARLVAALSATLECLSGPNSLEHDAFPERARHFANRLEQAADPHRASQQRSPVVDRLFVDEAGERLDRIRDALALLPVDGYEIRQAAEELAQLAEPLELDHIGTMAGRFLRLLLPRDGRAGDLDEGKLRSAALDQLSQLEQAVATVILEEEP